jgi:hypothetical protein
MSLFIDDPLAVETDVRALASLERGRSRHSVTSSLMVFSLAINESSHFPWRRKIVTVVFLPPISGAIMLYTPTKPETIATFCTPRASS